jgi:hypothetical protein
MASTGEKETMIMTRPPLLVDHPIACYSTMPDCEADEIEDFLEGRAIAIPPKILPCKKME